MSISNLADAQATSTTYNFPATTVSGQLITVDRLANYPVLIYRMLRTLVEQHLIGDRILSNRVNLTGTGSGVYEISEAIFPDFNPQAVPALSEYPLTTNTPGTVSQVTTVKWGQAFDISQEQIAHNRLDIVRRNLTKVANKLVFNSDSITLAAVSSAVTQTQSATATWGGSTATPVLDIMNAVAVIRATNLGYNPDTVILTPAKYALLMGSPTVLAGTSRNTDPNNVTLNGEMNAVAGLNVWWTTNMPSGVTGMVLDSTMLGSQAYEDLGGGYTGQPGFVESQRIPLLTRDGYRIQARIVRAPMVQEPAAAVKLTGI